MFYITPIVLLITPFSYGIQNWTFNENINNIIPKNMKEFKDQAKDMAFANPETKNELEAMISKTENVIPNFDVDVIQQTSKQFEELKARYEKRKDNFTEHTTVKNVLRQGTVSVEQVKLNQNALKRAFALMTQFVYAARYKLAYGQMLRTHYKTVIEYRIGYCFALMRDIRQQEMVLYSTMHFNFLQHTIYKEKTKGQKYNKIVEQGMYAYPNNGKSYADFHSYFQIYEKIVKLDVNMRDVVLLVKHFLNLRGIGEKPNKQPVAVIHDDDASDLDY